MEFAGRDGPVHDALSRSLRLWHATLRHDVITAKEAGDLPKATDPEQVVFMIEALAAEVKPARLLLDNKSAASMALRSMRAVLERPPVDSGQPA